MSMENPSDIRSRKKNNKSLILFPYLHGPHLGLGDYLLRREGSFTSHQITQQSGSLSTSTHFNENNRKVLKTRRRIKKEMSRNWNRKVSSLKVQSAFYIAQPFCIAQVKKRNGGK